MRLLTTCIALCLLMACNQGEPQKPKSDLPFEVVDLRLEKSNHVTIRLMFSGGSISDPADKKGLTNLTASLLMDGGTQAMSKEEIDNALFPMATGFGSSAAKEVSVFSTTIHKDHLDSAYPIFRDLLLNNRFDPADFERVKKRMVKAVTQDIPNNNDEVFSKRALDNLMFDGHPYQHLVQGTASGLESITLEDVKAHAASAFVQKRLLVGLAGGYDDAFRETVLSDMQQLPMGEAFKADLPEVPMPDGIVANIISKPRAFGSAIYMGYPLQVDRSSDEFAALMVANSYFGEHRKSYGVLYKQMRRARSLNYGDYSYIEWYPAGHVTQLPFTGTPRGQNAFTIWIRPVQIAAQFKGIKGLEEPELGNGHFVIRQSLRELKKLVDEGMTEEDFQRTRQFLKGYIKLYVQSQSSRLGFLMDSRYYGREDYISEMGALLDKLTLEDVNNAIKKYLQADNFYVAVITDQSEADKLAESMRTNGSAPIVYKPVVRDGLDKEITDEDKLIDAYKLNVTKVEVIKNDTLFK